MMNNLAKLNAQISEFTSVQILEIFIEVGKLGDIIIFKNDGQRKTNYFTVIISSGDGKFDSIRFDSKRLDDALRFSLTEYLKYLI